MGEVLRHPCAKCWLSSRKKDVWDPDSLLLCWDEGDGLRLRQGKCGLVLGTTSPVHCIGGHRAWGGSEPWDAALRDAGSGGGLSSGI